MRAMLMGLVMLCSASALAQTPWQPNKPVEIVIPSGPGGGNDRNARGLQRVLQENKWLQNVSVINKVGGGGALATNYVNQHANDAHYIVFVRQGFLSNHILGRSPIGLNDMTALAMLTSEPSGIAVRAGNTALKSLPDLLAVMKKDPQSVTGSLGSTRFGTPHMMLGLLARASGIDARKMKLVTFAGGAESSTQLLGGHIDFSAVSIDNSAPHHRSGAMRILGVSSPKRLAPLPDVPTFKEQGFDVVMSGFTIVMGPRGLTPPQVAYWENLFERVSANAEWQRLLAVDLQELDFKSAAATRDYLKEQYELSRGLLAEMGAGK